MSLTQAKQLLLIEQNYPKAILLLEEIVYKPKQHSKDVIQASLELLGLAALKEQKAPKAIQWFEKANNSYMTGYSALLIDQYETTQKYWGQKLQEHPFHWCGSLYGMVSAQLNSYPTFFQLRNYLEATIADFFKWEKTNYLHNLFSYSDFLAQINMESYKYIGRGIANNTELLELAEEFFLKSQKLMPQDPEIYFHLGQLKVRQKQTDDAKVFLKQALAINPSYSPVRWLLESIQ